MINKKDFNYIICLSENKLFTKQKKKLKFFKKLCIHIKYRRTLAFDINKFKEYWYMFMRLESLFGFLPKISTLRIRRKGKIKKTIFLRSILTIKSFSINDKIINEILGYIFNLHNYLYIKFLLNKKHRIVKLEEMLDHFIQNFTYIQHNSFLFENNLYFKWLDLNRKFLNIKEIVGMQYKRIWKFFTASRRLKYYKSSIIIYSNYYKFFVLPVKILIKNYKKLILFLFKKFRKRKKKIEKTYILL